MPTLTTVLEGPAATVATQLATWINDHDIENPAFAESVYLLRTGGGAWNMQTLLVVETPGNVTCLIIAQVVDAP